MPPVHQPRSSPMFQVAEQPPLSRLQFRPEQPLMQQKQPLPQQEMRKRRGEGELATAALRTPLAPPWTPCPGRCGPGSAPGGSCAAPLPPPGAMPNAPTGAPSPTGHSVSSNWKGGANSKCGFFIELIRQFLFICRTVVYVDDIRLNRNA